MLACAALLWACSNGLKAQVIIDSLEGNGQLTVTVPTNSDFTVEMEIWRLDEIGTSWTNFGEVTTVEAYENVTVPAGSFTNCIRLHQRDIDATETNSGQRIWIKPGLIEVKSIQYENWTSTTGATPIVSQLLSWSDE